MAKVLILYSTTDGHTREICGRIEARMAGRGHSVTVQTIDDADPASLGDFDQVVIGASIRYGKHQPVVKEFIDRHQALLESRPNGLFSVNVVARKPDKNTPQTNPYMNKFMATIAWRPRRTAVFAGRLDYPSYGFADRTMIRFIMWMTKGPTAPDTVVEFTDWDQVEAFAEGLCDDLEGVPAEA